MLQTSNARLLYYVSLVITIVYVLYMALGTDLTNPPLTDDAKGFWTVALRYYEGNFSTYYTIYPYILNWEFHIFGRNYLCAMFTNVFMCHLMILLTLNELRIHFPELSQNVFITALICLLPYNFINSVSLGREPIYILFLCLSFIEYSDYVRTLGQKKLYLAVFLTIPVLIGHTGFFPIPLIYFISSVYINKIRTRRQLAIFIFEIVVLMVFVYTVMHFNSIRYITKVSTSGSDAWFRRIAGTDRDIKTAGGSAYLTGLVAGSWLQVLLFAPIKLFFFLFSPLPVNWRGMMDIVTFLADSTVHLYIICIVVKAMCKFKNIGGSEYEIAKWGFIAFLMSALVFAMGTGTAGTAIRHRDSMIAIEYIILLSAKKLFFEFQSHQVLRQDKDMPKR